MAAKKNKKKILFTFGKPTRRPGKNTQVIDLKTIVRVLAVMFLAVAFCLGFYSLFCYVKKEMPISDKQVALEIVDPPVWLNQPLKDKILNAAIAGGLQITLAPDIAHSVHDNLVSLVSWLDDVTVQATRDSILIKAKWRKPVAVIESGSSNFYVDRDLVVLDYLPMPNLPVIKVTGLASRKVPPVGTVWQLEDLSAAVAILVALDNMDERLTPNKPLLEEIERIDVSNFQGRKKGSNPHIVLYAVDGTQILWGAQLGKWHRYMEASDKEKLGGLYEYYTEFGTLLNGVKYINLRRPLKIVQPVDGY